MTPSDAIDADSELPHHGVLSCGYAYYNMFSLYGYMFSLHGYMFSYMDMCSCCRDICSRVMHAGTRTYT